MLSLLFIVGLKKRGHLLIMLTIRPSNPGGTNRLFSEGVRLTIQAPSAASGSTAAT